MFLIYIPPVYARRDTVFLSSSIIREIDYLLDTYTNFDIVLCGDLNRFDINDICQNLNLVNCNNKPTYGKAELDYILLSRELSQFYVHEAVLFLRCTCMCL